MKFDIMNVKNHVSIKITIPDFDPLQTKCIIFFPNWYEIIPETIYTLLDNLVTSKHKIAIS